MNESVMACHHGKQVLGGAEVECGVAAQLLSHGMAKSGGRVQPGADGGTPQRKFAEWHEASLKPDLRLRQLIPPGRHFIAKAQRNSVLQVCAANFDDWHPSLGLVIERFDKGLQCWQQLILQLLGRGDMNGSRKDIVGGL